RTSAYRFEIRVRDARLAAFPALPRGVIAPPLETVPAAGQRPATFLPGLQFDLSALPTMQFHTRGRSRAVRLPAKYLPRIFQEIVDEIPRIARSHRDHARENSAAACGPACDRTP